MTTLRTGYDLADEFAVDVELFPEGGLNESTPGLAGAELLGDGWVCSKQRKPLTK